MGHIVQDAWRPVYHGQDERHADIAAHFLAKYKDYLFHGEEAQLNLSPEHDS